MSGVAVSLTKKTRQHLSFSHWSAMSGQADAPENYHIVTVNLAPEGKETKVILTQANLTGGVFFFQAEDGIRYRDVTGVQTCALPISGREGLHQGPSRRLLDRRRRELRALH